MPWASQRTRSGPGLSCSHAASSVGSSRKASNPGTYGKAACPIAAARATTSRAGKVRTTTAATGWSPVYATWAPAIRRSGGRGSAGSTVAPSSCLGALALGADDEAGRPVAEHDAGRPLVDVLPAAPARADELLLEVLLAYAEPAHRLLECVRLLRRDGEHYRLSKPGTPAPRRPCPAANRAAPARPTPKVAPPRRRSSASPSSSVRPKPRIAASRSASIVSCGKPAISSAHSSAVGTARSSGTTAFTRPKPRASRAPTARPRRIISSARPRPTTRGRRCVPPSTSGTPQRRSKQPNTALSPATRRSHQRASSSPPGPQYPV